MSQEIQQFAGKPVRTYWDDNEEKYYFCIIDAIEALTDSTDPSDYFKKLRKRDPSYLQMANGIALNGLDVQGLLRIIQSIPSKKAEPFKRLGYSDNWINQRLKSIEIRKDLTDQWKEYGVEEDTGYATLTNIVYQTWAGLTAKEYKHLKGLHKENRDIR